MTATTRSDSSGRSNRGCNVLRVAPDLTREDGGAIDDGIPGNRLLSQNGEPVLTAFVGDQHLVDVAPPVWIPLDIRIGAGAEIRMVKEPAAAWPQYPRE